jgi:hypothetical protein
VVGSIYKRAGMTVELKMFIIVSKWLITLVGRLGPAKVHEQRAWLWNAYLRSMVPCPLAGNACHRNCTVRRAARGWSEHMEK